MRIGILCNSWLCLHQRSERWKRRLRREEFQHCSPTARNEAIACQWELVACMKIQGIPSSDHRECPIRCSSDDSFRNALCCMRKPIEFVKPHGTVPDNRPRFCNFVTVATDCNGTNIKYTHIPLDIFERKIDFWSFFRSLRGKYRISRNMDIRHSFFFALEHKLLCEFHCIGFKLRTADIETPRSDKRIRNASAKQDVIRNREEALNDRNFCFHLRTANN